MKTRNELKYAVEATGTLVFASFARRDDVMAACVDPAEHDLVQLTLRADYGRQAAYRRLALTILGLDIPSLIHMPPPSSDISPWASATADRDRFCGTPRLASVAAIRLASGWRSREHTRRRSDRPGAASTSVPFDLRWRWPGNCRLD